MAYFKGESFDHNKLHEILLEMTLDIQNAMESENIPMYVLGGTMIGWLRGQKFVPWDDDVDIGFEEKYQTEVKDALLKHLSGKYIVECPNTTNNPKQFFRVIKPGTTMIRDPHIHFYQGIDIEVFPLGDVPDGGFARKAYDSLMKLFLFINKCEVYSPPFIIRAVNPFKKMFLMVFDKLADKSVCSCMGAKNDLFFKGEVMPKKLFGTPIKRPFEGAMLYFPEDTEGYLRTRYGDASQLPPESKRVPTYLIMDTENGPEQYMDAAWELELNS